MTLPRPPADARWIPRGDSAVLLPFVLGCVDRCARPIAALCVEPVVLRELLLRVRLLLDLRGTPAGATRQRHLDAPRVEGAGDGEAPPRSGSGFASFGLVLMLTAAWFAGLLPAIVGLVGASPAVWMATVSGLAMGFLGMIALMQSVTWVMDTTDIGVIAGHPVSDRTLFAARLAHVGVYVSLLALAYMFWPLALGPIRYPWWAVLTLVPLAVGLSALLAVSTVGGGFGLLLRLVGPRRFQRVTFWAQILLSTLAMGGFQVLAGSGIAGPALRELLATHGWLAALLPPLQFGGLFAWVLGERTDDNLRLLLLALGLPLLALGGALLLASRHFLAGLSGGEVLRVRPSTTWSRGPLARLGRRLLRSDEERAGYEFCLAMSRRDRLFVRSAWPMLAGMLVLSIAMAVPLALSGRAALVGPWLPFALYGLALAAPGVLDLARVCETPDARWLFRALPVADPRLVLRGGVMALLFGTLLPLLLVAGTALLLLAGLSALPDVLLAAALVALVVLFAARRMELRLPFTSAMPGTEINTTNLALVLMLMPLVVVAAGAHAALRLLFPLGPAAGAWCGVPLVAWLVVRAWHALDRVNLVDAETGRLWQPPRPTR